MSVWKILFLKQTNKTQKVKEHVHRRKLLNSNKREGRSLMVKIVQKIMEIICETKSWKDIQTSEHVPLASQT